MVCFGLDKGGRYHLCVHHTSSKSQRRLDDDSPFVAGKVHSWTQDVDYVVFEDRHPCLKAIRRVLTAPSIGRMLGAAHRISPEINRCHIPAWK